MENNKKKLYIGIIVGLLVLIAGLIVGICIGGKKSGNDDKTEAVTEATTAATTAVTEDVSGETTTEAKGETTEQTTEKKADENSAASYLSTNNGWESEGKYFCQYDFSYTNSTSSSVTDWKVVIKGCKGVEVSQSWNCEVDAKDDTLTFTAASYNEKIEANQKLEFGFIISAPSKDAADKLPANSSLYFGDKKAGGEATESATEKQEAATEKATEAVTEKTTENTVNKDEDSSKTPFENHGKLTVKGTDIVDKNGNKFQLKGVSTHGIAWFPDYVNKDAFKTIRDEWGGNLIRLAMYTDENGGYCSGGNKDNLKRIVSSGVDYATELGMYVIIDWHILHDLTPLKYQSEAESFFDEMSKKYKDNENVIYEICNEPNGGTSWADVKKYAEAIIPIIRKNDPDAIIVVGTPTWSQDVDKAAENPITGYDNIMYTVHFYAATHKDDIRNKLKTAREKGLAIFVTEFSICDASGNGALDLNEAGKWMDLINENNISYACWSLCNKDESSALLSSKSGKKSGWSDSDLSDAGKWLVEQFKK